MARAQTRYGMRGAALIAAGVLLTAGCSEAEVETPPVDPAVLADAVELDAVMAHLTELERIAGENDGNRSLGTPGYDASVDYVAGALRDAGFDVQTPEFDTTLFAVENEQLTVDGEPMGVSALGMSPSTGPEGLTARVVRIAPDDTPGCEATDYDGIDATGAVVIVDRGVCTFAVKEQVAAERGAAALLVANNEDGPLAAAGLGAESTPRIPVGGVAGADAERLSAATSVTVTLQTRTEDRKSRNVIAQTRTGSTDDVVVVGAHLDSVPEGPGINDNGTGVAAVLGTALQLGSEPDVTNAVRFAFWGAEEVGLVGSTKYVESLSDEERLDIALYLNFDMLGSPNAGYLVFDGDDSDAVGEGPGPEGSAGIERTFAQFFDERGIEVGGTDFDGRSDYGPFVAFGIPAGGVFTGADDVKTPEQADLWGGTADQPFDPNYHTPEDTLAGIDRDAFAAAAAAVAYGTAVYANSIDGPDGVPAGDQRAEVRAEFTE
ncbi:M20/M25/M40 family metallo-hydrolase [Rhodococcus rhodochrous]|uniref:M20/M25/M40 family metallo-hydrolase n=1 Tax=Rhodococcus rhodochrous TaxID=1829 RepID=UPI001E36A87D|nr:M20/M25/M40 family metallo-hydrolase [Rhodococcus rhodochrous]MCD2097034.1 M20/M25/M40 family metallo-hydrolase [Rhodococcus rhodochrous]MCD2120534.1 M20/M25/M40 family metallo-hydrolase [Rhodococcus rhodochrous]MCQ4137073.1 M20/M25/M40 family metallo-hydrolase [Rhodococcus rhodochrous]MDJ0017399.1 M20/M25/M40 family metallo-hydrolase [Rhodococcus rhodochrous]